MSQRNQNGFPQAQTENQRDQYLKAEDFLPLPPDDKIRGQAVVKQASERVSDSVHGFVETVVFSGFGCGGGDGFVVRISVWYCRYSSMLSAS